MQVELVNMKMIVVEQNWLVIVQHKQTILSKYWVDRKVRVLHISFSLFIP